MSFFRFWVVRESDGKLYCSNVKPYRNYRSEWKEDYEWYTSGDFMEINSKEFDDLKFTDDPVEATLTRMKYKIAKQK